MRGTGLYPQLYWLLCDPFRRRIFVSLESSYRTMANRRIAMKRIRLVLRMLHERYSVRSIATYIGIGRNTVTDYVTRAKMAGIAWPLPVDLDDQQLEKLLFPGNGRTNPDQRPLPDWGKIHEELRARAGATLQALHAEYVDTYPDGIGYSYFCECYQKYVRTLKRYLRRVYKPGERVLVDYAGPTMDILDLKKGTVSKAQIFVGVMGASLYTYAEAHPSQSLPNWISAQRRMLEFFGGAPAVIVCDNLKSGVTKASRTDPVVNATYQNFADHYDIVIVPTRPRSPKDKSRVENGVLVTERWILFRLRNRIFTSFDELNSAISDLLIELNSRPFKKLPGCRQSAFESVDLPALRGLPMPPYAYVEIMLVRIGFDYTVFVHGTRYTVPEFLVRQEVELRISPETVEVFWRQRRVASHARKDNSDPVINPEHMPAAHRAFALWESRLTLDLAQQSGRHVFDLMDTLLADIRTREQGYRLHNALQRLLSDFSPSRVDAACCRAIAIGAPKLNSVRSILRNKLDQVAELDGQQAEASIDHENVRGAHYYN